MEIIPFLLFILCCIAIVGAVFGLFYLLVHFGRGESHDCALSAAHGAVPNESREKQERLGILLRQNSNARYVIIFRGIFPLAHRPLGTPSGQNGTQYMTCSN